MSVLVRWVVLIAFALGLTLATQTAALAERRIALVIGNGKYENAGVLTNPANDANAIGALLKKAGFDVVDLRLNLGVVEFKRAVREFVDRAANADVAVVYYSGHGLEYGGVNYLIPVDAKLTSTFDIDDETVSLDRILVAAGHVKKLSLIILDACRENPFHPTADDARVTRGVSMGLAGVDQSVADTLIAFAAKAGSVSYDGDGANSPFTTALLKYITQPGLDIRLALGKVRDDVLRATNHRQEPFVYGSLGGDTVALVPAVAEAPSAPAAAAAQRVPRRAGEAARRRAAERGYERGLGLSDGRASRLARRLARLPRRSSRRLLRAAGPGGDRQAPRQSESGGVEDGGRAALGRRALQARRGPPRSPARQSRQRRGRAFRLRTRLRAVAAATCAPDGKPGIRASRPSGARQSAGCDAGHGGG